MLGGRADAEGGTAGPTVRNAVEVAGLVLRSALARTESRGAHCRAAFPRSDAAQAARQIVHPAAAPSIVLDIEPAGARPVDAGHLVVAA